MPRRDHRLFVVSALFAAGALLVSCKGGSKSEASAEYASYQPAGFDQLASFIFEAPLTNPAADQSARPAVDEAKIPATVKALSGKDVRVTGFMIPVKLVNGLVTEFLLVKDQASCCYGASPTPNHWVMVRLPRGVKNIADVPVNVYGRLTVGPVFDSGNYLIAIYGMEAQMAEPAPAATIPVASGR